MQTGRMQKFIACNKWSEFVIIFALSLVLPGRICVRVQYFFALYPLFWVTPGKRGTVSVLCHKRYKDFRVLHKPGFPRKYSKL